MGWLNNILRKKTNMVYADMLNGYTPIFSQFGQNIYASDVVQQAINCIVMEVKKLTPMHVREIGNDITPVNSDIQAVLDNPNEFMTTSEFIEKIVWQLFFNYNSFIIPSFYTWDENGVEKRKYTALYPVQPSQVDFLQDEKGVLFVKMRFQNGFETTVKYRDIIHIKYKYSVNQYMGGNESGQPDNDALLKTLELNNTLLNGVASAMKSSFAINGVVKFNTMLDDGKTEKALNDLVKKLEKSESGFLPLDYKSEFIPIKKDIQLVDATTLKFIDEKILRQYGVPLKVLTGEYTKEEYEAFYQKTIEPIIISFSQSFTKTLFTDGEKSHHNKVMFYTKDLIFMSMQQVLEMIRLLGDSGTIFENEKRTALGMKPMEELKGVRMQSLNYVNTDIANRYQARTIEKGGAKIDAEGQ